MYVKARDEAATRASALSGSAKPISRNERAILEFNATAGGGNDLIAAIQASTLVDLPDGRLHRRTYRAIASIAGFEVVPKSGRRNASISPLSKSSQIVPYPHW